LLPSPAGDVLGSNVVNIALFFGLALLYRSVQASRQDFSRDFYLALAVPVLTFFLMLDGLIERPEVLVLLVVFLIWLV
jgi:cation:H+ antiporter